MLTALLMTLLLPAAALAEGLAGSGSCTDFKRLSVGIANAEAALGSPLADSADACCALCVAKDGCNAWTYHFANHTQDPMRRKCWLMPYAAKHHGTGVVSGVSTKPCPAKPCAGHPGRTYCPSLSTPGQCNKSSHPPCPPCRAPTPQPGPDPKPALPPPAGPTQPAPLGFRPNVLAALSI